MAEPEPTPPRFSVIIPTYQRREQVVSALGALTRQQAAASFEVIVVVDGSRDGSADALRELVVDMSLNVLEQPNRGAASARNRGAAVARGEILLFLDDDMEAHPALLREHARSHSEGADVVLGHIPLHPESRANVLSAAVGAWAEERAVNLVKPTTQLTFYDMLVGQISIRRETFNELGGFDERFTRHGSYGNEDLEFGQRILDRGLSVVFNPRAISWQRYDISPREHLRQWRQTGRADVIFARKRPDLASSIFVARGSASRMFRLIWRPTLVLPGVGAVLDAATHWSALAIGARPAGGTALGLLHRSFRWVRTLGYWRGVRDAGGIPRPRTVRVLAYHALTDLTGDAVLSRYGVPRHTFERQLDQLIRSGYHFISPDELIQLVAGRGGVPRRSLLLTFDDCYADLRSDALPLLVERGLSAIAFAVTKRIGGENDWDASRGARTLDLLDADGLRELAANGVEVGAHSRTHRRLDRLSAEELRAEIGGSLLDLLSAGHRQPRFFSYPYGQHDERVRTAAKQAGLAAAFTTEPGLVKEGQDEFRLPRIEILREDVGVRLRLKVARAGRWPTK